MKLLITTCLKESKDDIARIFNKAHIHIFSSSDIIGHKDGRQADNLLEDWFARGEEQYDSVMVFSFTSQENAEMAMGLIEQYNNSLKQDFPARAFMIGVEKSVY